MHRVIVWGTGFVGKAVLRSVATHPAYEIVAVVVHDPEKDGRDVGEILGTTAMGLAATRDSAAALAMEAFASPEATSQRRTAPSLPEVASTSPPGS